MPVNNLLPLSSRSTFPYLLCNNGQEPFRISALVSTIFSSLREWWWRALSEEGDSQQEWEHISQGPAPATRTVPQWPHRPSLTITFLWASQHRHHILLASHQCPSSLATWAQPLTKNHRSVLAQASQHILRHPVGCNYTFSVAIWTLAWRRGHPYKFAIP